MLTETFICAKAAFWPFIFHFFLDLVSLIATTLNLRKERNKLFLSRFYNPCAQVSKLARIVKNVSKGGCPAARSKFYEAISSLFL